MASAQAAWGIEIGDFAIKAIRLERSGDEVEVSDFAVIPHRKVLTTPDVDASDVLRLSLGQFVSQHSLEGEQIVMSVAGHSSFVRFAKLPPVEPKKIPDIVRFEAVQQIPFPIQEVEWDYHAFTNEDSPEIEVGLFAVTREKVKELLDLWEDLSSHRCFKNGSGTGFDSRYGFTYVGSALKLVELVEESVFRNATCFS